MSRESVKSLVCGGLGFCCVWMFFRKYRQTGMIAERLGVADRTVRYYKARFKAGEFSCEKCPGCLKGRL